MKIHVEVFIAGKILEQHQSTFSPNEIIDFLRTEFCDERHGIPTHVSAACIYHHKKTKDPRDFHNGHRPNADQASQKRPTSMRNIKIPGV